MTSKPKGTIGAALARGAARNTPGVTSVRTKPIRITLDLVPDLWGDVQRWIGTTQIALRRKVELAPVLRAILAELADVDEHGNPTASAQALTDRITERIRQQ